MSDETIKLTIDGREVTAKKGMTVLQVCDQEGIDVPRYCYHPGLSISGNCRICMVEVEGMPNTQISCYLPAADGMVVHTQSDPAKEARQHVLEFLLVNHPVDCPVCDQSGECQLQNYYMEHGQYESRLNDDKVLKRKTAVLGPHVILDAERCILCSRCVRFTDEISETHELGIFNRHDRSEIHTAPGVDLDNAYSACTVDICPVGALTERDFRFQMRVWYLDRKPSVCPSCSRGCNIEIHHNSGKPWKAEGRRLLRIKPRVNPEVNQWWMCDEGRFGQGWVDSPDRLRRPLVQQEGGRHESSWESALETAAKGIRSAVESHGADAVGVLLSPWMTVEEMQLARRVFTEALGVKHIGWDVPPAVQQEGDDILRTGDPNPNRAGAEKLGLDSGGGSQGVLDDLKAGRLKALVVWRQDLTQARDAEILLPALENLDLLVHAGTRENSIADLAHVVLPVAAWVERSGSFINVNGRLQTFDAVLSPPGEALSDFRALADLGSAAGVAFSQAGPQEMLAQLAQADGPLAGADLDAARALGKPWHINGLGLHEKSLAGTPLADEEGI